ncbi:MAG: hypothetical protein ACYTBR_16540 [Planctomycetota bacterium]
MPFLRIPVWWRSSKSAQSWTNAPLASSVPRCDEMSTSVYVVPMVFWIGSWKNTAPSVT